MSEYFNWSNEIKENELKKCDEILKNQGIVIFPTETVYGIGANALSDIAVKKIFDYKKRPYSKAINILIAKKNQIENYAIIQNEIERKIINNFMPGPITIILKKKNNISKYVTAENDTIGVRIPDNKIALEILNKTNLPIATPSANISGMPSGKSISQIKEYFDGKVDVFIDGGTCKEGIPSTIIQVINNKPVVLREGKIKMEDIISIL